MQGSPAQGGTTLRDPRSRVPIRTIAATIAMVLLTTAVLPLGWEVRRVLTWIVVAALHSLPAAIVVLVVFVVYQQLENHTPTADPIGPATQPTRHPDIARWKRTAPPVGTDAGGTHGPR